MTNCYHCNAENRDEAIYCKKCGQPVVRICSECEHEIEDDATFCDNCGTKQH